MLSVITAIQDWFYKQNLKKELREEYRNLVFLNFYGELEVDFDAAQAKLFQRYVSLGFTMDEVQKVISRMGPMVRIEG